MSSDKLNDDVKARGFSVATVVAKHKANFVIYTALAVTLLWAWHFVSDGDFSFLMVRFRVCSM